MLVTAPYTEPDPADALERRRFLAKRRPTGERCLPVLGRLDRCGQDRARAQLGPQASHCCALFECGQQTAPDGHCFCNGRNRAGDDRTLVRDRDRASVIRACKHGSRWSIEPDHLTTASCDEIAMTFSKSGGIHGLPGEHYAERLERLAVGPPHPEDDLGQIASRVEAARRFDLGQRPFGHGSLEQRSSRCGTIERAQIDSQNGSCRARQHMKRSGRSVRPTPLDHEADQDHRHDRNQQSDLDRTGHRASLGSSFHGASARANASGMPWRRMRLRNAEVFARCDERGELVSNGGRVEVRYKPGDGRAYFAAASNLGPVPNAKIEPDSHCGPAEAVKKTATKNRSKASSGPSPERPEGDEVLVYADGACSGNPGPAGVGVVALWDDEQRELSEYIGEATNNIAELTAVLRAVELAREIDRPLRIYTDSQYSIGVLTRGWKAKANKELVARVRDALSAHPDAKLFHVRGHEGVKLNEHADELAVRAVRDRRSTGWLGGSHDEPLPRA